MKLDLNTKLSNLRILRADIGRQEALLRGLKNARDNLQDDIIADMKTADTMSMRQSWGSVSVVEQPSLKITDPIKVQWWLKMNNHEPDAYMRLDQTRAKAILEHAVLADGEVVDGTMIEKTHYLQLREKAKNEQPAGD